MVLHLNSVPGRDYCGIADSACLSPVGFRSGGGWAQNPERPMATIECHWCGMIVCRNCSMRKQRNKKRMRLCHDCIQAEYENGTEIVLAHLRELID